MPHLGIKDGPVFEAEDIGGFPLHISLATSLRRRYRHLRDHLIHGVQNNDRSGHKCDFSHGVGPGRILATRSCRLAAPLICRTSDVVNIDNQFVGSAGRVEIHRAVSPHFVFLGRTGLIGHAVFAGVMRMIAPAESQSSRGRDARELKLLPGMDSPPSACMVRAGAARAPRALK
ncbi:hypothetical protein LA080_008402 [Diaporthe eres]|nr:hypothetical protein LA080_008402 [Diaporthe eres]